MALGPRHLGGLPCPLLSSPRSTEQVSWDIHVFTPNLGKTQRLMTNQITMSPTIHIQPGITPPSSIRTPSRPLGHRWSLPLPAKRSGPPYPGATYCEYNTCPPRRTGECSNRTVKSWPPGPGGDPSSRRAGGPARSKTERGSLRQRYHGIAPHLEVALVEPASIGARNAWSIQALCGTRSTG